jgi:processing peptidase subunit alpha
MLSKVRSQIVRQHVRMAHISAAPPRQQSVLQAIFGRSSFAETPMSAPYPEHNVAHPAAYPADSQTAKLTTLSNGMRVVSHDADQASAHVGVHIDAGSRYEDSSNHGVSSFLETHALGATTNRSAFRLRRELDMLGLHVGVTATRDQTSLSADCLRDHLPHALGSFSDILSNSEFHAHELPRVKDLYSEMQVEPRDEAPDLTEAVHAAAFKNNTLGNNLYASKANLQQINTETLVNYTNKFWTPNRMVVSGVGVQHAALVDMCNEFFGTAEAGAPLETAAAVYTGGDVRIPSNDGLTHVSLGFQSPNWLSDDVVPLLVLQTLMGGGGAFSAGGPGKGMLTRLYRNVLNGNPWVISSKCDTHVYNDSGLFTINGDCMAQDAENLVGLLVRETLAMTGPVNDVELSRAKNQLKSSILLALESRQVKQQDMAQQVMTYGNVTEASGWVAKINAVTGKDLQRVAAGLFQSPLTVAATGDVSAVPSYSSIQGFFTSKR